ncbi:MAG TPA: hypothetical protein VF170_17505 [Planctomycetaceae bacterium]
MNLRRWGVFGVLFGAAAFVGCNDDPAEEIQEKREDVLEAQQEVREEQAELLQAEREAQLEAKEEGRGPVLVDPTITAPAVPPEPDATGSAAPSAVSGGGDFRSDPDDVPNEGNPDAGTGPEPAGSATPQGGADADEPSDPPL